MSNSVRRIIIAILLSVFLVLSTNSLTSQSATFDEVQYFGIGKYLLVHHKWDVMGAILHPPLTYYLGSVPLLFVQEDQHLWEYEEKIRDLEFLGAVDIYRGQGLLSSSQNADDRLLIASRLMTTVLSLLLGYFVYRFSRDLYGEIAGILSLFFFTFCPNMLAFSGLSVPDMPLTVFSFISIYYFWLFLKKQSMKEAALAGIFLGLALSTKFTALLLIPVELLLYVVFSVKEKKRATIHIAIIMSVAFLVLLASYGFDFTPYIQGNEYRLMQLEDGQWSFLHGNYSTYGWWYYYPIAFLLKTPVPVLLLSFLSLFYFCKYRRNRWFDELFLYVPVAVIFAVFCSSNYSVALRYILPIYPFIFVSIGSLVLYGKKIKYLLYPMALWYVASSISIAPHYLAYFNEIVGGPGNGYKYLVDGNLDWGQDLKSLKKFMDANGIKKISLSYFGADSPQRYGISYDWLPSYHLYNPTPDKPVNIPPNQLIAVSATNLQGLYLENKDEFKWLKDYEPVAKIGYSIFIYDLSGHRQYKQ